MSDEVRPDAEQDPTEAVIEQLGADAAHCVAVAKSYSVGGSKGAPRSRIATSKDVTNLFQQAGAIAPPCDPQLIDYWLRNSPYLRPNIGAYVANIDSFGHRFDPAVDLRDDDALAQEVYLERLRLKAWDRERLLTDPEAKRNPTIAAWPRDPWPKEAELPGERERIEIAMRREKAKLVRFFGSSAGDVSFKTLRRRTRYDLEGWGYAFWEVLRDETGALCEFTLAPTIWMRITPQDTEYTASTEKRRVDALGYESVTVERRYRRYVQLVQGTQRVVYFKELGDPRCISGVDGKHYAKTHERNAKTGDYLDCYAEMDDGRLRPVLPDDHHEASEMIHWSIHSPGNAYGQPRWWSALLEVAGSREAGELNYRYFKQNQVPPLLLILEGAEEGEDFQKQFAETVESRVAGTANAHKIMTISLMANPGAPPGEQPRAKLERLRDAQQADAQFLKYCQRADDVISMQFRQPRILRGDSEGHNRANADAALAMTEAQVYQPEREEFDDFLNRRILPDLGILYWTYVSNATKTADPESTREMLKLGLDSGALIPEDGRPIIGAMLDRELGEIDEPFMKQPLSLSRAQVQAATYPPQEVMAPPDPEDADEVDDETMARFKAGDDDESFVHEM